MQYFADVRITTTILNLTVLYELYISIVLPRGTLVRVLTIEYYYLTNYNTSILKNENVYYTYKLSVRQLDDLIEAGIKDLLKLYL